MRLKSFYAKTMSEAMKDVRETLGEDAIIVATREDPSGRSVTVTAAVDNDSFNKHQQDTIEQSIAQSENPSGGSPFASHQDRSASNLGHDFDNDLLHNPLDDGDWNFGADMDMDETSEAEAISELLTDVMIRHGASEQVTDEILSCISVLGLDDARISLVTSLESLYKFDSLPDEYANNPYILVGPPGAGKTLMVAKMAARCVMNGQRVAVITTDTIRAGGVEQLEAFTKILNIDLLRAHGANDLKKCLAKLNNYDFIFIDTPGANPFDPEQMRDLAKLIAVSGAQPAMVLPAGTDAQESGDMARTFAAIGTKFILPTRFDIARRLGGILTAAHQGHLTFLDASHTSQVAQGLLPLTPRILADYLLPKTSPSSSGHSSQNQHPQNQPGQNQPTQSHSGKHNSGQNPTTRNANTASPMDNSINFNNRQTKTG